MWCSPESTPRATCGSKNDADDATELTYRSGTATPISSHIGDVLRVHGERKDVLLTTSQQWPPPYARRLLVTSCLALSIAFAASQALAQAPEPEAAPTTETPGAAAPAAASEAAEAAPAGASTAPADTAATTPQAGADEPAPVEQPNAAAELNAEASASEGAQMVAGADESTDADADPLGDDTAAEEKQFDFSDLEAEASASPIAAGPKLDIYGFADFTYQHWLSETTTRPTFFVGNFNIYLSTDFGSNWRALSEIRFLYLPHGGSPGGALVGERIDTTVADYADISRPLRWGGIEIERVWLEYMAHPLLNIRGGQWLTPYGIWNVDHGSPAIIAANRPFIVGEGLIPERQTGLQIHGSEFVGSSKLGYHVTLSNGRGPTDAYADLDRNKAIGGRLFFQNSAVLGDLTIGVSGYRGRYSDRISEFVFDADGTATLGATLVEEYDEFAYAADLRWIYGGLHLQSEVVGQDIVYNDAVRPAAGYGAQGTEADFRRWGGYALLGYRFDFLGVMPYVNLEYYDSGPTGIWGKIPAYWFGINVRPVPSIVLKAQYLHADGTGSPALGDLPAFDYIMTQAAWSF